MVTAIFYKIKNEPFENRYYRIIILPSKIIVYFGKSFIFR